MVNLGHLPCFSVLISSANSSLPGIKSDPECVYYGSIAWSLVLLFCRVAASTHRMLDEELDARAGRVPLLAGSVGPAALRRPDIVIEIHHFNVQTPRHSERGMWDKRKYNTVCRKSQTDEGVDNTPSRASLRGLWTVLLLFKSLSPLIYPPSHWTGVLGLQSSTFIKEKQCMKHTPTTSAIYQL